MINLLDCTMRDGGYYTNWDFSQSVVEEYAACMNKLPIEYIEIGYRSPIKGGYLGQYFYCPVSTMKWLRRLMPDKKLVILINEKDVRASDAASLLMPCQPVIDLVRIAVNPSFFERSIELSKEIKSLGFKVALNCMYMSEWSKYSFLNKLHKVNHVADIFCMVDSFGGMTPQKVSETIDLVRPKINIKLGFHGHNNLELALANTLTAIDKGCDIVDSTMTGMGRGAGNLKTELLLTYLKSQSVIDFNYNDLSVVLESFYQLKSSYNWGTSLPYMVSGVYSLPQKNVMEWVTNRSYSINSVIRALDNMSCGVKDNEELPVLSSSLSSNSDVLIIGGGKSCVDYQNAIIEFIIENKGIKIIYASSKNANLFSKNITNEQYYCLIGREGYRLEKVYNNPTSVVGECVLPPYPREMGTYIPNAFNNRAYQLASVSFTDQFIDSHTAIAIETAITLNAQVMYFVGYDGYGGFMSDKEQKLSYENDFLFSEAKEKKGVNLVSLTPTKYMNLSQESIFARI